jgi:hypothetical protein
MATRRNGASKEKNQGKKAMDLEALLALGKRLDRRVGRGSYREVLAASLLKVRNKRGRLVKLETNLAQREFELKCGPKNIVLKARQMGISTWVAARFFLSTITRPGTLTVQVAHTQEAAEEIFRMVHRFVENLPPDLKRVLKRSRSNRGSWCFRGWTASIAWRPQGTRTLDGD